MRQGLWMVGATIVLLGCAGAPPPEPPPRPALITPMPVSESQPACKQAHLRFPPESKRLGESGTVVVRALVGPSGSASKVEVDRSSGFGRLDQAAMDYVGCLKFRSGLRNGMPTTMWFVIPLRFDL